MRAEGAGADDLALREMVRAWAPGASRTSQGFLKGVSLKSRIDPFTGQRVGG